MIVNNRRPRKNRKVRSVFATRTGRSALIGAIAGFVVLVGPDCADIIERRKWLDSKDLQNIENIILKTCEWLSPVGALGAIAGRASAKDKVASPGYMPGYNKKELEEEEENLELGN